MTASRAAMVEPDRDSAHAAGSSTHLDEYTLATSPVCLQLRRLHKQAAQPLRLCAADAGLSGPQTLRCEVSVFRRLLLTFYKWSLK